MAKGDGNMTRQKVTDPALLSQLGESPRKKVTDPALLKQLNSDEENVEDAGAYLDNLPKSEGSHPLRDIMIGLTHAGRNLHNLPHDTVSGIEKLGDYFNSKDPYWKKHQKPKDSFKLSEHLPNDEQDYSDIWGGNKDKKTLLDKIIQGGVEHAPELIGAGGLIRGGFRRLTGTHHLNQVERAANRSGVDFNYHPNTVDEARNYLPTSHATNEMIQGSEAGGYTPSFSMQSQVGHHQRTLANSPLAADRLLAPRAGELKQSMLGELGNILRRSGMHHEADLLGRGINNYRQYMRVRNAVLPVLKQLGIPVTVLTALGLGFKKVKKALSD